MFKTFGQITHAALQRSWCAKKDRHHERSGVVIPVLVTPEVGVSPKGIGAKRGNIEIAGNVKAVPVSQLQPGATVKAFNGLGLIPATACVTGAKHAPDRPPRQTSAPFCAAVEPMNGGASSKNTPGEGYMLDAGTHGDAGRGVYVLKFFSPSRHN